MRASLAKAATVLRLDSNARRVPPENFHLTLAFVGEVSDSKLEVVRQIGSDLRAAACEITVDAAEYWAESQVLVLTATETPPALLKLCSRLHQELALHPADSLRAHVTLARKVSQAPVLQAMSPLAWSARSFSLVRSDTGGARSVYTVVDTWPLLDEMGKL